MNDDGYRKMLEYHSDLARAVAIGCIVSMILTPILIGAVILLVWAFA